MSFVRCLGLAALLFAVAACDGGSSNTTPGGPNAAATTITVTTSKGAPLSELEVTISTGFSDGNAVGAITSEPTDGAGQVRFENLPSSGQLCVSTSTTVGGQVYRADRCAQPFPGAYTLKFSSKMPG